MGYFELVAILVFVIVVVARSLLTILTAGCWSRCATPNGGQSLKTCLTAPKLGLECSVGEVTANLYRTQVTPAEGTPAPHSLIQIPFTLNYILWTQASQASILSTPRWFFFPSFFFRRNFVFTAPKGRHSFFFLQDILQCDWLVMIT